MSAARVVLAVGTRQMPTSRWFEHYMRGEDLSDARNILQAVLCYHVWMAPRLARVFCVTSTWSLAVMCPAFGCGLTMDRWP